MQRRQVTHFPPLVHKNEFDGIVFTFGDLDNFCRNPALLLIREPDSSPFAVDVVGHGGLLEAKADYLEAGCEPEDINLK